jgi:hypothetical protein
LGIQIAGVGEDGLFDVLIVGGTVVFAVVTTYCTPCPIGQPDCVSIFICFFILHMQKFLSYGSSVIENPATAVFFGVL